MYYDSSKGECEMSRKIAQRHRIKNFIENLLGLLAVYAAR